MATSLLTGILLTVENGPKALKVDRELFGVIRRVVERRKVEPDFAGLVSAFEYALYNATSADPPSSSVIYNLRKRQFVVEWAILWGMIEDDITATTESVYDGAVPISDYVLARILNADVRET